jgi:type VI secretion system secreted protein Hcp
MGCGPPSNVNDDPINPRYFRHERRVSSNARAASRVVFLDVLDCLSGALVSSAGQTSARLRRRRKRNGQHSGGAVAADIFAKIGDIKGESFDDKHKDEIEVLSWSWGITNAGAHAFGGGGGAGKASFHDLSFTHKIDKASPVLMKSCATGQHIKEATLVQRKAGKGQQEFLIIKMNDVVITGISDADGADAGPVETISLAFAKVDLEYKPQKADGSVDAGLHFKYDLKTNKEG